MVSWRVMNAPTHLLISATILTQPGQRRRNAAAIVGALLPDAFLYVVWLWSKVNGIAEARLWREIYWTDTVQLLSAISNSAPLYAVILMVGAALRRGWVMILALSALLHIGFDLPFHHSDAHRHFWPLADWRFNSPLSYWEPGHHALWVGLFEIGLGLMMMVVLWRRFDSRWVRALLIAGALTYIAVPLYFTLAI